MVQYVVTKSEARRVKAGETSAEVAPVTRKRHAKVGERIALDVAKAAKKVERLATPLCVFRARLAITAEGLVRAFDIDARSGDPWGEAIGFLVRGAEDGAPADHRAKALKGLAERCGFDSWAALYADVLRRARSTRHRAERLDVELIAWGPLQ